MAGDSVEAEVDVGSGNLLVTVRAFSLPAVNSAVTMGAFYNSSAAAETPVPRLGKGWGISNTPDIHVVENSDDSVAFHPRWAPALAGQVAS